ncbi:MAG TPA: tetratricopeptide repeat protein [Acetobacteraceae bacterium]|nr:tetratricopeptide repeat protein [Acetobacteraceae bacterium]
MSATPDHRSGIDLIATRRRALALHQAGDLAGALALYDTILSEHSDDPDTLHLAGVAALQQAQHARAAELIERAIALRPSAPAYANLGAALRNLGRVADALAALRLALELDPTAAEAHSNLAAALLDAGEQQAALDASEAALRLRPDLPAAHLNHGRALLALGRHAAAVGSFDHALALQPNWLQALLFRGNAQRQLGRDAAAAADFRHALAEHSDYVPALTNLAPILAEAGHPEAAVTLLSEALRLAPGQPEALLNLGCALRGLGRLDEARASQQQIIAEQPDYWPAWTNLAAILHDLAETDAAITAWDRTLALHPAQPDARYSRALTLLLMGDFARGWTELEWRWQATQHRGRQRHRGVPLWTGEDLARRTILLHAEEGLGDSIQFARYVPLVAARGASVVLEVYPALARLFRGLAGVGKLVVHGDALPPCDLQCPLQSLPRAFATRLETIPGATPYLRAEPGGSAIWADRLGVRHQPRVGLVWAGSPTHGRDRLRSIALDRLAPLLSIDAVAWFSLQVGRREAPPPPIVDLSPHLTDLAETAAALCAMDLLISVDTSVAHLAGALARPVWLLLPFSPDWRWMLRRSDTPWYPTMRLFRQTSVNDWDRVIESVAAALQAGAAAVGASRPSGGPR